MKVLISSFECAIYYIGKLPVACVVDAISKDTIQASTMLPSVHITLRIEILLIAHSKEGIIFFKPWVGRDLKRRTH